MSWPGDGQRPETAATRLVGRDPDFAVVRAFVDQAARQGGSLVVSGEAGVGKSELLEAAAGYAAASGLRLLRATGAQFEADDSFAALHQLLFLLLDTELTKLNDAERTALLTAFGSGGRAVPDRMALSRAALELLAQAATTAAIMIVVDDLPWLDQASAAVLSPQSSIGTGETHGYSKERRSRARRLRRRLGLAAGLPVAAPGRL